MSALSAPHLPEGFSDTFSSRFIEANGLRQHVVVGGEGPPLLLVHGWPQDWSAWRLVMPALARDLEVVAPDQRGIGETDKPRDARYDPGTLAEDLVALMDALGHERFAVIGHDTGHFISYALAADHPHRVDRVVLAEVPGPPGVIPSPPLFIPEPINNRLWHIPFNRVDDELTEQLVRGREDIFFGYEFAIQGGKKLPDSALRYYFSLFSDPDALRGSFGWYRELDTTTAQNARRATQPLTIPVLGVGGAESLGDAPASTMKLTAGNVQTLVLPGCGHWVAEQAPEELLAALTTFLAPYRDGTAGTQNARPQSAAALP